VAVVVVTDLGPCPACCGSDCVDCCDPPPPATLYATFTGLSPGAADSCGCIDNSDSFPLTYGANGSCLWSYEAVAGAGGQLCADGFGADVCSVEMFLSCSGGVWVFQFGFKRAAAGACDGTGGVSEEAADAGGTAETDCDPLEITFSNFALAAGNPNLYCGSVANYVVTITE
jgi:hypothetical protein